MKSRIQFQFYTKIDISAINKTRRNTYILEAKSSTNVLSTEMISFVISFSNTSPANFSSGR